jgi:hypothetical protein
MKTVKLILASVLMGAVATSAFSQGYVAFTGGLSNPTKVSTNSVQGGAATGRTGVTSGTPGYYFALFVSSTATTIGGSSNAISGASSLYVFNNMSGWTEVGTATNNLTAGGFAAQSQGTNDAGQGALNSDGSLSTTAVAGAANGQAVIIGWSANIGSTITALQAWLAAPGVTGWIGQSAVSGALTFGNGTSQPAVQVMGSSPAIGGFTLGEVTVPEPGTMALAALGGASLFLFRRKK